MYALCAFLALANLEVSPITPPEPPPSASRHWPTGPPTANGFHHTLIRLTSTSENHSFSYVAWSCCGPLVYIAIHFAYRTPSSLVPAVVHPPPTARPSTPPLHTTDLSHTTSFVIVTIAKHSLSLCFHIIHTHTPTPHPSPPRPPSRPPPFPSHPEPLSTSFPPPSSVPVFPSPVHRH
ncbi:hypothetical protein CTRI78_v004344 [Colletotrichum trifolii]|uniref:Uncharacterized protein n=1 Tax=Colletotrichum trifolii TaxID=5466 RepID=A0A4V6QEY7_COLTR|nr:hypothetical protein CTRI78_v004344 [Colletotrichum trifolii]